MEITTSRGKPEPGGFPSPGSKPSMEQLLERIAVGVEKLAEDPVIYAESKPPYCPHCERINPSVTVEEKEATGELGSFVILARCNHCNKAIYALPILWECFPEVESVVAAIDERAEQNGFS